MVETALTEGTPIDLLAIRGWIQRGICLIGNANTALATKRRKAILMKIEPKLINLAISEPGTQAKGLLFRDDFVKTLGKYVNTFTALDKAQKSMKRKFSQKVFGGVGRQRGRLSGRSSQTSYRGHNEVPTSGIQSTVTILPDQGQVVAPAWNQGILLWPSALC
ncbi:Hypothetical predicted protein [Pelobates cultripes]|uniref:Uncharacterized protein n=1 Tax=Pelobates cultripes TaxID=61616 RepID=A0AAD1SCZ7_PELCU|nr:Hypothetical predicted protein [Pelobates cultripes]